jgi:hypothetical protein
VEWLVWVGKIELVVSAITKDYASLRSAKIMFHQR